MKNTFFLLLFFLLSGCSATKVLKEQNQDLQKQATNLESTIDKLTADNSTLNSSLVALERKVNEKTNELKICNEERNTIKTFYDSYTSKLMKMKAELHAAFPDNLNEANFSIREEDGRLIITIPNKILYQRGSADFNSEALEVIKKLTKVFNNNENLQILVEGHTDETPLKAGSRYKDNWDLSVARAVNIVRQFATYGVRSQRLTAAGRGYFAPINRLATEEARAMNRRVEIIIRPKITDLIKMLDEM